MKNKESEYQEIFLAEALGNFEDLNRLLTILEQHPGSKNDVNGIFRIVHTLKGNASGMGYTQITEVAHILEDIFGEVREGRIVLDDQTFPSLFKAVDTLGALINAVKDKKEVKYRGIKTKLEVLISKSRETNIGSQKKVVLPTIADDEIAQKLNIDDSSPLHGDTLDEEDTQDQKMSFSDLVQVPVRKLDNLLNLVSELMIEKDRILASQIVSGLHTSNEFSRLSRISSDLQYSVMDVRLVQVGFLFNKFHRVIRDAAEPDNKQVNLKLEGTDTEIDRNVLQVISDSLIHIIRNAVAHGIETPEERIKSGKRPEGTVTLKASNENDAVLIEICDDGRGINYERVKIKAVENGLIKADSIDKLSREELSQLIFEPGFSTMEQVTAIAGRGVGMDVVRKTLDSIGGTIKLASTEGKGTVIQLSLPSSMAVKSSLLFELFTNIYAIPLAYTESVISIYKKDLHKAGGGLVASHLGKNVAVVFLKDIFEQDIDHTGYVSNILQQSFDGLPPDRKLEMVVVTFNNRTIGFVVDKLLQQKEIVEKPLMRPVDKIRFISGVTILGTGNVCLVLNVPQLLNFVFSLTSGAKAIRNYSLK